MTRLTNEFAILLEDYLSNREALKELDRKAKDKPSNSNMLMRDILTGKLNRLSGKIRRTGTSNSIIKVIGVLTQDIKVSKAKNRKRFELYFINEFALADLEILLQYYSKDIVEFATEIIPTGKIKIRDI